MYDDEKNPKLYLVESEVPRVKTYLGLRKARSEQESAVFITCTTVRLASFLITETINEFINSLSRLPY